MTIKVSNVAAIGALDDLTARLDGTTAGVGSLQIRSGTIPTDADAADGGTLLAEFDLDADAFDPATDANPGAVAVANAIADVNASNTGTATYFRLLDAAGVCVVQGSVSAAGGGGDCIVTSTSFVSGQPCHVVSVTLTHPE